MISRAACLGQFTHPPANREPGPPCPAPGRGMLTPADDL